MFHLFLFRSSKFSRLYHFKASSKSLQGFTLCFQLLFLSIILLLLEFFMEALHGGSSRILSFLNCSSRFLSKLWPSKLHSKINMMFSTCFVLRSSSILHLASEVQFFLPYLLRWCYVTLANFLHVSWFICCQEWGILNPSFSLRSRDLFDQSTSSLELSWDIFHLKPSIRNVLLWCL